MFYPKVVAAKYATYTVPKTAVIDLNNLYACAAPNYDYCDPVGIITPNPPQATSVAYTESQFYTQFNTIIESIITWYEQTSAKTNGDNIKKCDIETGNASNAGGVIIDNELPTTKLDKLRDFQVNFHKGSNWYAGDKSSADRFINIKKSLEEIVTLLTVNGKDDAAKLNIINWLLDEIVVCGPGVALKLVQVKKELQQQYSVDSWLAEVRSNLICQMLADLGNNNIHNINEFFNRASTIGISTVENNQTIEDPYTSSPPEIQSSIDQSLAGFKHKYTFNLMVENIKTNISAILFKVIRDNSLTDALMYSAIEANLRPVLGLLKTNIAGDLLDAGLPINIVLNLDDNCDTGFCFYSQNDIMCNLQIYITYYLLKAGYVALDSEYLIEKKLSDGAVIYSYAFNNAFSWVKKDGLLYSLDQYKRDNTLTQADVFIIERVQQGLDLTNQINEKINSKKDLLSADINSLLGSRDKSVRWLNLLTEYLYEIKTKYQYAICLGGVIAFSTSSLPAVLGALSVGGLPLLPLLLLFAPAVCVGLGHLILKVVKVLINAIKKRKINQIETAQTQLLLSGEDQIKNLPESGSEDLKKLSSLISAIKNNKNSYGTMSGNLDDGKTTGTKPISGCMSWLFAGRKKPSAPVVGNNQDTRRPLLA